MEKHEWEVEKAAVKASKKKFSKKWPIWEVASSHSIMAATNDE